MIAVLLVVLACLVWPRSRAAAAVTVLEHAGGAGPRRGVPSPDSRTQGWLAAPRAWSRAPGTAALGALTRRLRRGVGPVPDDHGVLALLDALGAALAAGLTPAQSLRVAQAGPTSPALAPALAVVLQAADEGRPTGPAWERVARRHRQPDLATLAQAWSLSERLGCPLADAVQTTARSARTRTVLQQRLGSATAGARSTCSLLSALPLGGVVVALLLGIDPILLYGSPLAIAALGSGLLLLLLGRVMVGRMISRVLAGVR